MTHPPPDTAHETATLITSLPPCNETLCVFSFSPDRSWLQGYQRLAVAGRNYDRVGHYDMWFWFHDNPDPKPFTERLCPSCVAHLVQATITEDPLP